jgi:hypothetical protein
VRLDQDLVTKAANVATRAPQEWGLFIEALKSLATTSARECVNSPPEQLQRMQGRAQQCLELAILFEGAVKSATRIAAKKSAA